MFSTDDEVRSGHGGVSSESGRSASAPELNCVSDVAQSWCSTPGRPRSPASVASRSLTAWMPLWGTEIRFDRLIVRGALLTRRYRRGDIVSAQCQQVRGLADWILGILFNSPSMVFYVLRVRLETGRTKTLYASNSSKPDIDRAERIVTAWLTSKSAVATTAPLAA